MGIPGSAEPMLLGGVQQYQVERSLRFNSADSAALTKTFSSAGNRQIFTISFWFKNTKTSSNIASLMFAGNTSDWSSIEGVGTQNVRAYDYNPDRYHFGTTNASLRDPSAWMHFVFRLDNTSSDRTNYAQIWINGVRASVNSQGSGTQNTSGHFFNNIQHYIGNNAFGGYLDGYLAEFHACDGQLKDAYDFGETDTITGAWIPKKYSGSYGTNGFYLKFDPSATNGIGHDHSGNGNNWTATGFSTSGTGTDVMSDTPTTNWCTWSPVDKPDPSANSYTLTLSNGNLDTSTGGSEGNVNNTTLATFQIPVTGKWYWEILVTNVATAASSRSGIGIINQAAKFADGSDFTYADVAGVYCYTADGKKSYSPGLTQATYGSSYTNNDVIGVAVDAGNGKIWFAKNGTWQNSGDPAAGTNEAFSGLALSEGFQPAIGYWGGFTANFGQRAFAYTPPTGYKALNTANLPEPTIKKGSKYFNTVLWTGNAANPRSITGVGFSPDFVWTKKRNAAQDHFLYDAVRGSTNGNFYELRSSSTSAEGVPGTANVGMRSLDSDGFTIGSDASVNTNNDTYVAWAWDAGGAGSSNTAGSITSTVSANASAGFSIVSYQSQTSTKPVTVGHGLGVKPSLIIFFNRISASSRAVYHSALGATKIMSINSDSAATTSADYFNNTEPTSTVFTVNDSTATHNYGSSDSMIAYCFSEVAGYSKFGSYQGNGSSDGPFVFCGFRPAYVWLKGSTFASNWNAYDSARDQYNITDDLLRLNSSAAEVSNYAATAGIDLLSNGFKIRTSSGDWNSSGQTFVFVAFAVLPFKYANAR